MRGGYGTGEHGTLAERTSGRPPGRAPERLPAPDVPATPASPARHCLVDGQPSLLVEWRRSGPGAVSDWEGRVISVAWMDAVGWVTLERWLPASAVIEA